MKIVSVQDISCYGQCSLTVALPVLSAYGIETAILPSGILSTHTGGFTDFTFLDLTEEMSKIVNHWKKEGITYDAIYTGYIGDARQFDLIRNMRTMLNKDGLLIVDPAMADHGKLYAALDQTIVEGMRSIVHDADVILPNLTEAAFLLGETYKESYSREEITKMLSDLAAMGPEIVILTGVSFEEDKIGALAYNRKTGVTESYFTVKMPQSYHGTGDIFSSIAIANLLNKKTMSETLKDSCDFIVDCIKQTMPDQTHNYGVKFEEVLRERMN